MDGLIALALAKKNIKGVTKSIAEEYDPTKEYAEGALVIKDGKLQKYVGGEWVETIITDNLGGGDIVQSEEEYVGEVVGGTLAPIDPTLSTQGAAADAKATGDAISQLSSSIAEGLHTLKTVEQGKVVPVRSINEFNINDEAVLTGGYLDATNTFVSNASYIETGYIPCSKDDTFTFWKNGTEFSGTRIVCYYDTEKSFISGTSSARFPTITIGVENAAYFRTCFLNSEASANCMIVKNDTSTHEYVPYYVSGTGTDRNQDILDTLTEYGECVLGEGFFYVSGLTMPEGTKIRGYGNKTHLVLMASVADGCALNLSGNNTVSDMVIEQQDGFTAKPNSDTMGTCDGIRIVDGAHIAKISNCEFYGFNRSGVYGNNVGNAECYSVIIDDCVFEYNVAGIFMLNKFEYASVSNCVSNSNYYGVINNCGNNCFSACHFDKNSIGWYTGSALGGATNNGHGTAVGCTFNHSAVYGVYCSNVQNGYIFSGCQLWYSPVFVFNSICVCFVGCQFGGTSIGITFQNVAQGHRLSNCVFSKQPTIDVSLATTTTVVCTVNDCWLNDGSAEVTID